jgi:16S rRNA (uracil1498-N3)-methyltransferase
VVGGGAAPVIRAIVAAPVGPGADRLDLDPRELHHLGVRRVEPGAAIEVVDGRGGRARGHLRVQGRAAWVEVHEVAHDPPPVPLVLLVGAGDRDRFLWLAEKAQELGVTRLVPVVTDRVAGVATRLRAEHLARLVRRAAEALKQSGGAWLMSVESPVELGAALAAAGGGVRWVAAAAGRRPEPVAGPATVLVGPEGGLTAAELEAAAGAGFVPVALGARTLRFETAALAAASVITALGRSTP